LTYFPGWPGNLFAHTGEYETMADKPLQIIKPRYTNKQKYTLVGNYMHGRTGSFLDLGAGDRVLLSRLPQENLEYKSHDLGPGHDFDFDLEAPIPLPNCSYDYTAALDILEHIDNIHQAFHEILRITRQYAFITLPNIAVLSIRARLFFLGRLGDKYHLPIEPRRDRHRWVTVYPEILEFVSVNASKAGFVVEVALNEIGYVPYMRKIIRVITLSGVIAGGLFTRDVFFVLRRVEDCK
jgi:hypothetical protein